MGVDVATYKAEFLAHYYEGRLRPPSKFVFGNVDISAHLASVVPGFVNMATQLPVVSEIAKLLGGVPRQRRIPALAPQTFKSWFARRKGKTWVARRLSSLARYFQQLFPARHRQSCRPEVLEAAGFHVLLTRGQSVLRASAL